MKSARTFAIFSFGLLCVCAGALGLARVWTDRPFDHALTVRAVAHQWWWEFDYPSLGIKTSEALYLPSDREVQIDLVSADVIHSFWITGMKQAVDIFPGKVRSLDLEVKSPGELHGNCDSGCGCNTVCMRFRLLARAPADFERWAANQRSHPEGLKAHTSQTPACAIDKGRDGHTAHNSPASHLQQLLDAG